MTSTNNNPIAVGHTVTIDSPGHRQHAKTGTVVYGVGFMGTIGVDFNGDCYGFWPEEVVPVTTTADAIPKGRE
ncbi:hypothetical protein ANMWB30_23870 [Arthrobacter sp. MWB30]|nr:hypothetical protein ANMWB30_23870 [Arthrobacter sp. MWB30]